ncbi:MAG: hypothetical protein ACOYN2_04195 [Patescibacteria group bacterium]
MPLYDSEIYSQLIAKTARESALATLEFVRTTGVPAGPTTGAVYASVMQYFQDSPIPA